MTAHPPPTARHRRHRVRLHGVQGAVRRARDRPVHPSSPTARARPADLAATDRRRRRRLAHPAAGAGRARPGRRGRRRRSATRRPRSGTWCAARPATSASTSGCRSGARSTRRCVHLDAGIAGTGAAFETMSELLAGARRGPHVHRGPAHRVARGRAGAAPRLADRLPAAPRHRRHGCSTSAAAAVRSRSRSASGTRTLRATVLDFPPVLDVARDYRDDAGLAGPHRAGRRRRRRHPAGRPDRTSC